MKKTPLFLLIISFLLFSCNYKKKKIEIIPDIYKNHLQQNHLFGNIKEINTLQYLIFVNRDSTIEEKLFSTNIQQYSADGFLKNLFALNRLGDTILYEIVSYNENAQVKKHEKIDKRKMENQVTLYKYDNFGHKNEEQYFTNDSLYLTLKYKTDNKGNTSELIQQFDSITIKNEFFYNADGLVQRINEFEPSGKLFKYTTFEYDNYGDEVNRRVFNSANNQIEYTYTVYNQNGELLRIIYEDYIHNLRTTIHYSQHDKHGNWTVCEYKKGDETIYLQKRTIIYY